MPFWCVNFSMTITSFGILRCLTILYLIRPSGKLKENKMNTVKKLIKVVTFEGTFPELPTPKMYVQGRGEGGSMRSAACSAMRDLMSQPQLKSRRITVAKRSEEHTSELQSLRHLVCRL